MLQKYIGVLLLWMMGTVAQAQEDNPPIIRLAPPDSALAAYDSLRISRIHFIGNRKTKALILHRELDIQEGTWLAQSQMKEILLRERNKIFNTDLFVTVDVRSRPDSSQAAAIEIEFLLKERWYLFPVFIFELADRNFNEWWRDRGADLRRTNYGARFVKRNVRGRNETLELLAQFGFTQKFEVAYFFPYLDRRQRFGLELRSSYSQNKEIAFETFDNKLNFYRSEEVLRDRFSALLRLRLRDGFYRFHYLSLNFAQNRIADSVALLNPNYFWQGNTEQRYWTLTYQWTEDRRDVAYYPLNGHFLSFISEKVGLSKREEVDLTRLTLQGTLFRPLSGRWFYDAELRARLLWQNKQPYAQAQGLGYGEDFLRSYQFYVIDGQNYGLFRSNLKYELFNIRRTLNFVPLQEFRTLPLALYARIYFDAGYVQDQVFTNTNNQLANTWLYGSGVGLDLASFYNLVFQIDYGINRRGETGLFFNIKGAF